MSIETQLFEGKLVRLTPIDHEKDPEVESRWTHDLTFGRALWRQPAMPLLRNFPESVTARRAFSGLAARPSSLLLFFYSEVIRQITVKERPDRLLQLKERAFLPNQGGFRDDK